MYPFDYNSTQLSDMAGLDGDVLKDAPNWIKDDQEAVLAAVMDQGRELVHASDRLRDDKEVVVAAVKNLPGMIELSARLQNDPDVQSAAAAM